MRNETLGALLDSYRSEARISPNPAHHQHVLTSQILLLNKTARALWTKYSWKHLKIKRHYALQDGQRYYDITDDFDVTRIYDIRRRDGGDWVKLRSPINDCDYGVHESDVDERSWPVRAWSLAEGEQIEMWPIPDQNGEASTLEGYFRVTGMAKLQIMEDMSDTCPLDGDLVAKLAAVETLFGSGNKELAGVRVSEARMLLTTLFGNQEGVQAPPSSMLGVRYSRPVDTRMFPTYKTGDAT